MLSRHLPKIVGYGFIAVTLAASLLMWFGPGKENARNIAGNAAAIASASDAAETTEIASADLEARPLFHISRRPYQAPVVAQPEQIIPTLGLVGIINDGPTRLALVVISTEDRVFRVTKGDQIGTWTIEDIALDGLTVRTSDGALETLSLGTAN